MIEDKEIDRLKEIFVTRKECTETTESITNKLNKDMIRFAVLEQQQKINNWLTLTIVGGVIALLIKVYLGG